MKPKRYRYGSLSDGRSFFNTLSGGHFVVVRPPRGVYDVLTTRGRVFVAMRIRWRISPWLAVVLAIALRPGVPLAIENASARISSLGGDHVAGVIPDPYTDLNVNPAYAFFADRLIVGYAKRSIPGYAPSLPYLEESSSSYYGSSTLVNELSAWGIRLSSWRAAAFAQWAVYQPQSHESAPSIDAGWNYHTTRMNESWNDSDDDFAQIDLLAARALGDRYTLGLRLRGWGYYNSSSTMGTTDYYEYLDPFYTELDEQHLDSNVRSFLGRRLSFALQAGIVRSNAAGPETDLALGVSLGRLDYRKERYDLEVRKGYDSYRELSAYEYYRYQWKDARNGDLWDFDMTFRHSFDGGVRVLAGGALSTCSYETEWSTREQRVLWGWSTPQDESTSGAFDGDGSLLGGRCFFKGGRIFGLHETTDLYVGLHGVLARTRTEEEPLVHYAIAADGGESAVRIDQPTRIESTKTSFDLSVPLSVEFRPSGYFTFFSGFILTGRWSKQAVTKPMTTLFFYNPPVAEHAATGANRAGASTQIVIEPEAYSTDWERSLSTGSTVTLGFSLHYRDRFFIDVYSGTEIVPRYLSERTIDVRYAF
jgi:hypothetical protein